ncbi:hypothetical protein B0H21DRAFT_779556 [Amylocystis lapponica]|nr:hypothetical protein B0H21DRAFT_779556 [Amylocystis lapponica]
MSSRPVTVALATVVLFGALNALLDWSLIRASKRIASAQQCSASQYSFVGEDYPPLLPLPSARRAVLLTAENSVRYTVDANESAYEWLWTAPVGDHNVHLGARHRYFAVGMAHELHCLRRLRGVLQADGIVEGKERGHSLHCLNYLRQGALCAADATLEPLEFVAPNGSAGRTGGTHVCMDWPAAYEAIADNWNEWQTADWKIVEG